MSVALSVKSHFSLKNSIIDPLKVGQLAFDNGYDTVAIVDDMSINALIDLTKSCKKAGVKPIIGVAVAIYDYPGFKQTKAELKIAEAPNAFWMAKIYAKNEDGVKGIIKLLARANEDDYFYYTPRTGLDELTELASAGNVIILTGDFYGLFSHKQCNSIAAAIFEASAPLDFAVEIVPVNTLLFDKVNKLAYQFAEKAGAMMVATTPFLYDSDGDADSMDVMSAILSRQDMSSQMRSKPFVRTHSFKPISDLKTDLDLLSVRICLNTLVCAAMMGNIDVVADRCTYEWKEMPVSLPRMAVDETKALKELVGRGWTKRLMNPVMGYKPHPSDVQVYKDRLMYELNTLRKMGFERYFLLVSDMISWAKDNDIYVGPGRGSAAGSLVAYLLGITDVDPIRFGLIFERFINPDRIDLPDIDIDFASSRRHEVIDYLKDKYGEECVAGISNYVKLGSASGVRDVGKAFGLMPFDMTCTKLMPTEHGSAMDINLAADMVPEIDRFRQANKEIWQHAGKLIGSLRNYGKHAAGIIVAGEPINNRGVLERRSGEFVVNWDKNSVEKWGLIKVDMLSLSTLDIIDIAIRSIKSRSGVSVDLMDIPLDDEPTLKAFSEGRCVGVFQFDGCLSGDTLVDGMSIKNRYEKQTVGYNIRSLNESGETIEFDPIKGVVYSGRKRLFRVKLKDGREIKATKDHKFYKDGEWVKLEDLVIGDKLAVVNKVYQVIDYTEIESIEYIGIGDTYDIQMSENRPSFVANEIVVHNSGVRNLLKDLARDKMLTFDDVSAATALYRPGPIDAGLMKDYVNFKQGSSASYDHPNMKPALKSTGGVIIYQEQIMQIAKDVAGFTMSEADSLRKIIGKKQKDEMALVRDKWIAGCVSYSSMSEYQGGKLFDLVDKFAGYGFNKSHSVSYALISYASMWLKTHHPVDFFAASMSILDEDKMPSLVTDANAHGIEIYPPDINISTDKFEPGVDHAGNKILITPFSRIKGMSSLAALAIMEARELCGGRFNSVAEFESNVVKRRCNSRAVDSLDKVGAFAYIKVDDLPPRHPDRLRDQMELLPGLSSANVSVTRRILKTEETKADIASIYVGLSACADCTLAGGIHPAPTFGKRAEFMVITDCPSSSEDRDGKVLSGDGAKFIKLSLQKNGLRPANGYFTTLVKSIKNGKTLANEQINGCSKYLDDEIRILKPAVIVLMGTAVIKKFLPGEKKPGEARGKVVYSKAFDANFVVGINPAMLWFDDSKQDLMDDIFKVVADLINN